MSRPNVLQEYSRTIARRMVLLLVAAILLPVVFCISVSIGAASVPLGETVRILCGFPSEQRFVQIIVDIRLPQALAAIAVGAGLAISGAAMQAVLRNPLCSPFTLGISNAAAFGAALALFFGGGNVVSMDDKLAGSLLSRNMIVLCAFGFAVLTTGVILLISRIRGAKSETIILTGVALNSLFSAGIMMLQYMSDDLRLAAIVFWTFGDLSRVNWSGLAAIALFLVPICGYFFAQSWNYNTLGFGEETASGLGVPVGRVRLTTMLLASLLTAIVVSLLGIIGFVGLVVPHFARLCIGSDYRFLLPFSILSGGLLLLTADTFARLIHAPEQLPVSILTAFIGVPVFLSLLLGKRSI